MFVGGGCQRALVPALVPAPLPHLHSPLALKHFLPFALEQNHTLNLLPGFTSMEPVQKAVLQHTFGISPATKRKFTCCGVCQIRFNSQNQALSHYKGTKHTKKVKLPEAPKCKRKKPRGNGIKKPVRSPSGAKLQQTTSNSTESSPVPDGFPVHPGSTVASTESKSPAKDDQNSLMSPEVTGEPGKEQDPETEEEKALRLLYCSLCKVAANSVSQLEAHNTGTKHKTMLEARNGNGSIKSYPRPGVKSKLAPPAAPAASTGLQNKTFHCETCDVHVNSETQLKQHISSRRHKDRASGKPAKPKFSPYTKSQNGPTKQQAANTVTLPVGKDLCQSLTAAIVTPHLAAVAAATAAVAPSFSLHAGHNPSLFQTHPFPGTLLHPAPGPIRTGHAPILFAPY